MLSFIDSELELLHLKIQYPGQFQQSDQPTFKSDLYLIPRSENLGIIGIAEIVASLQRLGGIVGANGKPVPLIRLANAFEYILNLEFGSIYSKVSAVFDRKPYNRTKTLDALKNVILRKSKKQGDL